MNRFIFTNTASGAGCLKKAKVGTYVLALDYELVHGPAPFTTIPLEFFEARTALWPLGTAEHEIDATSQEVSQRLTSQVEIARLCDSIELWIDPTTNAQLQLIQLLDWLRTEPIVRDKLLVTFIDHRLGDKTPRWASKFKPPMLDVTAAMFELASKCWLAYRQSTPRPWFDLLQVDSSAFPGFTSAIKHMLQELPDARTGLIDTQRRILQMVSEQANTPQKLMSSAMWRRDTSVFGYWQLGHLLTDLANTPAPALRGMNGERFTPELHDDRDRRTAFLQSRLCLTSFGQALLDDKEDFAQHNPVNRWWGGTQLKEDKLWRWNSVAQALVDPSK
jgi:hypothetical protein